MMADALAPLPLPLSAPEIARFSKLLAMLGSDQGGDRAAAALKATGMLKEKGATWAHLAAWLESTAPKSDNPLRHRAIAADCLATIGENWTERERDFLVNMSRRRRIPTEGQARWLEQLREDAITWGRPE